MRSLARPALLGLVVWIAISALASSCKRQNNAPGAPKAKTPGIYHYTPLPDPPTPTLRPGQPTHPPEPAG